MEIAEVSKDNTLMLVVSGRVDGLGAGVLEKRLYAAFGKMTEAFKAVKVLIFDLKDVDYMSSAGLRILIQAYKHMQQSKGEMRLQNVRKEVMDILKMTGFAKNLKIHLLPQGIEGV